MFSKWGVVYSDTIIPDVLKDVDGVLFGFLLSGLAFIQSFGCFGCDGLRVLYFTWFFIGESFFFFRERGSERLCCLSRRGERL